MVEDIFKQFKQTHLKKSIPLDDGSLEYYDCGEGARTLLICPHISNLFPQEIGFRNIIFFEKDYRVIAPEISSARSPESIADAINAILEKEKIKEVFLYGQSGAGITAQIFFNKYHQKIKKMVLVNTIAPGNPKNKNSSIGIIKLLPGFMLRFLFQNKFNSFYKNITIPEELKPHIEYSSSLLKQCFKERFSKKAILRQLDLIAQFNDQPVPDLSRWKGGILIVTSEDDGGYEDSKKLAAGYPNTTLFVFEKGHGHLAPAINHEVFHSKITDFFTS